MKQPSIVQDLNNLYPISLKNREKDKELIGYLFLTKEITILLNRFFTCLNCYNTFCWRQTNRKEIIVLIKIRVCIQTNM